MIGLWRKILLIALLGTVASHAQTFVPSNESSSQETLIPAALGLRTDRQGSSWNFQQNGTLGRIGNSMMNTGMTLLINNQQFQAEQSLMTKDGLEFVLPGKVGEGYGGLSVVRRIRLDQQNAVVRYLESFQNQTANEIAVQVEIRTHLSSNYKNYLTNTGAPGVATLNRDQTGILVTPTANNVRRALVLTLRSTKSEARPTITAQSRYVLSTHFQIQVKPGETQHLLHTVSQIPVPISFDRKSLVESFRPGALHRNLGSLPNSIRTNLANFTLEEEARGMELLATTSIEQLGVQRGRNDILAVADSTRLLGEATCARLELESEFGAVELSFNEVAAIVGSHRQRRDQETVYLQDGQVLGGSLSVENLQFQLPDQTVMDLEPAHLDRLVLGRSFETGTSPKIIPDDAIAYLETHSGDRLALLPSPDSALELVTSWGTVEVRLSDLTALSSQESEPVGHQVELENGSRFFAFLGAGEFVFETSRFGSQSISPREIRAIVSRAAATSDPRKLPTWESPRISEPYLNLRGRQRLVGNILAPQLTMLTESESIPVNPTSIRYLVNQLGDDPDLAPTNQEPPFIAELWGGGVVSGTLRERVLDVRLMNSTWKIPIQDIVESVVPSPNITAETLTKIAKWISDLGDDDWKTRENATDQLGELGYLAKPQLIEAAEQTKDAEVKRRAEWLLFRLSSAP
tara:strand:+ start:13336 stop:15405 length:2070 start_codon:yes stop_codon:yes gene_type:complete